MISNLRPEIVQALNKECIDPVRYNTLKSCFELDDTYPQDINWIDVWFKGVISSLFYRPNNYAFCIVGDQGIGKTEFVRRLLPNSKWFSDSRQPYGVSPNLYEHLIIDMTDYDSAVIKKIISTDGFKALGGSAEKRLASVVYTSNVIHSNMLDRKRSIVLFVKKIDWKLYNSINKEKLWIEIFNKFVTE